MDLRPRSSAERGCASRTSDVHLGYKPTKKTAGRLGDSVLSATLEYLTSPVTAQPKRRKQFCLALVARIRAEDKELAVTTTSFVSHARARALSITQKLDWLGPLTARITLGVLFMSTGWGKVHNLAKVTAYFSELGIPFPGIQAPMVSFIELIGGALLLIGLASRIAALPLMASMAVAILTAQRENVHGLPDLFGLVEWTYFALLLWVTLAGPGKISLDHALFDRRRSEKKAASMSAALSTKTV